MDLPQASLQWKQAFSVRINCKITIQKLNSTAPDYEPLKKIMQMHHRLPANGGKVVPFCGFAYD